MPDDAPPLEGGLDLPYLVYGTLRPGGSNAHLIDLHRATYAGRIDLPGYAMLNSPFDYPYLVHVSHSVVGPMCLDAPGVAAAPIAIDVVDPPDGAEQRQSLRQALDLLEGFTPGGDANNYERMALRITHPTTAEPTWAWIYLAGSAATLDADSWISSGDWFAP